MHAALPRLLLTAGEPAGIGPELVVRLAHSALQADLVACADPDLLARTAARMRLALDMHVDAVPAAPDRRAPGQLSVMPATLAQRETPGQLDPRNAPYVVEALARASDVCRAQGWPMLTAPVHKGVINEAGMPFTGHTEFLAARASADVLMLLASPRLRVALATTHLPLSAVPAAITPERLRRVLGILHRGLQVDFGLPQPRIAVLGLNPHAGESGHLGREEIEIIAPVVETLRGEGMSLLGPLPADTAFVPTKRQHYDAVLAMYHDQALPVLKAEAFDQGVNITLGLPYVRTSVDHGTALDIAGQNRADARSMHSAAHMALELAARRARAA